MNNPSWWEEPPEDDNEESWEQMQAEDDMAYCEWLADSRKDDDIMTAYEKLMEKM